jgi:hypothetical protein
VPCVRDGAGHQGRQVLGSGGGGTSIAWVWAGASFVGVLWVPGDSGRVGIPPPPPLRPPSAQWPALEPWYGTWYTGSSRTKALR